MARSTGIMAFLRTSAPQDGQVVNSPASSTGPAAMAASLSVAGRYAPGPVASLLRRALGRLAARSPRGRRLLQRVDAGLRAAIDDADDGLYGGGSFDVVTVLETLEHLPPEAVPAAVAELRRVCRGQVVATIPSFGPNQAGPGGWFQVKVRDDRVAYYESLGPEYEGPIPHIDIYRDVKGDPIEGHLTLASFSWWTKRSEEAGFVRSIELERRLYRDIERLGLLIYWNLYVFHVPGVVVPPAPLRSAAAVADLERRWGLDERAAAVADRPRRPEEEAASAALAAALAD